MYLFAVVVATFTVMLILHYKSQEDDHGMWD